MPEPPNPPTTEEGTKVLSYKVITISLYVEDLRNLDAIVRELRRRGHTHASRSSLIRYALRNVDLDRVEDLR